MANYVKIAAIGAKPTEVTPGASQTQITEHMIGHWNTELQQVLADRPDLIVLPEECDRPFNLPVKDQLEYFEFRKNSIRDFFAGIAAGNNCYIVYSAARQVGDGSFRNSSTLIDRQGRIAGIYDKNHLTEGEIKDYNMLCGSEPLVVNCDLGRIGFAICFDLNFDDLRLKYAESKPNLILFSSMYHGGLMQAFWAHCCRSYFVGAVSALPSQIRNPYGQVISSNTNYRDYAIATVNLDYCLVHYDYHFDKLKALKAKYKQDVSVYDPGLWGSVMISSESEGITAAELATEFEIELLDDYLARSLKMHNSLRSKKK